METLACGDFWSLRLYWGQFGRDDPQKKKDRKHASKLIDDWGAIMIDEWKRKRGEFVLQKERKTLESARLSRSLFGYWVRFVGIVGGICVNYAISESGQSTAWHIKTPTCWIECGTNVSLALILILWFKFKFNLFSENSIKIHLITQISKIYSNTQCSLIKTQLLK